MELKHFLRSAWLFIVGVVVAIIGVYTLLAMPDIGSVSFLIMLVGLFFTGTGSIYGKRKLRGDYYMTSEEPGLEKFRKEKPKPVAEQIPAESEQGEEFLEEAEQAEEQRVERPEIETSKPVLETTQKPPEEEHVKVIKVIVCPKCGTENQETDKFCYNCGKKLRMKGFPGEKKGKAKK
jgi:preprotein translocase subunit Sss1